MSGRIFARTGTRKCIPWTSHEFVSIHKHHPALVFRSAACSLPCGHQPQCHWNSGPTANYRAIRLLCEWPTALCATELPAPLASAMQPFVWCRCFWFDPLHWIETNAIWNNQNNSDSFSRQITNHLFMPIKNSHAMEMCVSGKLLEAKCVHCMYLNRIPIESLFMAVPFDYYKKKKNGKRRQ